MRKRRLIVILGTLALVAAGAAWWALDDRLTPTEQLLIGTWRLVPSQPRESGTWVFSPDRKSRLSLGGEGGGVVTLTESGTTGAGRWSIRRGVLVWDDDNPVRRAFRPVCLLLGLPTTVPAVNNSVSVTEDELVLTLLDGTRQVWKRVPPD